MRVWGFGFKGTWELQETSVPCLPFHVLGIRSPWLYQQSQDPLYYTEMRV